MPAPRFLERRRAYHDGVRRGAKQSHDEAVALVESADIATAGLSRYRVADHAVERADEISNHLRAPAGEGEMKVSSVSQAEIVGQNRRHGRLLPFKKSTDRRHGRTQDSAPSARRKMPCSLAGSGFR